MSAKTKKINSQKRLAEKRARKASQQAKYAAWAAEGKNAKSKRAVRRAKNAVRPPRIERHAMSYCGNAGCKRCFPR